MGLIIKILCAYVGFKLFHIPGLILGAIAGHFMARGIETQRQRLNPEQRQQIESALFHTAFPLMGYLAKADGRVSEEEIKTTEELMAQMQLSAEQRQAAINLFKQGSASDFAPEPVIGQFLQVCGRYHDIKQMLLVYLIAVAMADGTLDAAEKDALQHVAKQLGFSKFMFEQLLKMAMAQQHFRGGQYHGQGGNQGSAGAGPSPQQMLDEAYQALGVESSCSDAELKKAYRKLMSQYHPDKLAGQGVPDEMLKVATERSQEIQGAYDLIKKSRKN